METGSFAARKWMIIIISGILISLGLYLTTFYSYLLFHSIAEVFIIVVAGGIFIVAWHSRRFLDNDYLLFIGIAYLFIAVLELIHALSYMGMGIFKGYGTNLPTQLWIAARYMESFSFLMAPIVFSRRLKLPIALITYTSATCLVFLSIFLWDIFPICFVEGTGLTPFKKISEVIISLAFIGSIVLLSGNRKAFDGRVYRLLVASIFMAIASEIAFIFYIHAYGISNLVGHYFKIVSFFLIYKAIIETGIEKPYSVLFRNLSESEKALRESEDKFRIIIENLPDGVFAHDLEGRIILVNRAAIKNTGYTRDELLRMTVADIDSESVTREDREDLWLKMRSGDTVRIEGVHRRKDGTEYPAAICLSAADLRGESIVLAVAQDITERKQAEEALRESEERYRQLFANAPVGIGVSDADGRIVDFNDAMLRPGGYSREDIGQLGNMAELYYNPDQRKEIIAAVAQDGLVDEMEVQFKRKDGTPYTTLLSLRPVKFSGEEYWQAVVQDIEERKRNEAEKERLEAQLKRAQEMESIGTLAGGIAHDFNNILGIIMGCIELSLYDSPDETPVSRHLTRALKATQRAKDLVRQILTFSRQGKQDERPLAIGIIIKEALKMLRSSLPTTIEIKQNVGTDTGLIMADPTQIHQIIMNLSTNAAHAMGAGGGVLDVQVVNVTIDAPTAAQYRDLKSGSYVKLTVRDTGHGMAPEVMERIFEPYYTTKEIGKGTGLGLAVVHGIVLSHGGVINVHSEPGEGTAFEIFLPKIDLAEEGTETEEKEDIPTGSERILFVDDEPSIVEIYPSMLQHLGYEVNVQTSSIEALEAFRAAPDEYDVIITDQTMPHLTGQVMAREMMAIRPGIPVILCTGHSDLVNEDQAGKMGIRAFMMKPVGMGQIARTLRDVLGREGR